MSHLQQALASASHAEASAVWNVLAAYVENAHSDLENPYVETRALAAAEALLERMNAAVAELAEQSP
jgi:hypothetical protein